MTGEEQSNVLCVIFRVDRLAMCMDCDVLGVRLRPLPPNEASIRAE